MNWRAAAVLMTAAAWGQAPQPGQRGRGGFGGGQLGEQTVTRAAERYKLTDEQKAAFTKIIEDNKAAAKENGDAIRKIFEDMRAKRDAGEQVDRNAIREQMTPLFEKARKNRDEVYAKFRDTVLNDEQKKQYDEDKAGNTGFFQRGGFGQGGPGGRGFNGRGFEEANWQGWLDRVSAAAKFTDEQKTKSADLLKLAKEAAASYRKGKEEEYKKSAADLAELRQDRNADAAKRKAVTDAAAELGKPIDEIGTKWKADVMALLSDEQKKAAEEAAKAPAGRQRGQRPQPPAQN